MIERLLRLLAEGGVHGYGELAVRLSISRPLLEMMLDDLVRRGYLRAVEAGCGRQCGGCAGGCGGSIAGPGRLWVLTDTGLAATARP